MNDQEFMVQKIRSHYVDNRPSRLEELQALDRRVKRPANVFAYSFGTLAALIMGSGMSLVMTDLGAALGLGDTLIPGIVTGVVGMVMAFAVYPIYKAILKVRRKKFAPQILALSEEML